MRIFVVTCSDMYKVFDPDFPAEAIEAEDKNLAIVSIIKKELEDGSSVQIEEIVEL